MSGEEGKKGISLFCAFRPSFLAVPPFTYFFCLATTFTFPIYLNDEMNEKPSEQSLARNQHKDYKYTTK